VARQLGNKQSIAIALLNLARAVHRQGDTRQALPLQREGLELAQAIGDKGLVAAGLVGVAGSLALLGRVERAAVLLGTAEHLRENLGLVLWRGEQLENDGLVQTVRHVLGEPAFLAVWTYGRGLSLDEAATLALADLDDSSG
jgi:hypothetical protein